MVTNKKIGKRLVKLRGERVPRYYIKIRIAEVYEKSVEEIFCA